MTHLTRLAVLATLILSTSAAAAQSVEEPVSVSRSLVRHVRGGDRLAFTVLDSATAASPTVARLVADLEQSDVIVTIVTGLLPGSVNGRIRFVVAAGSARHVRITLAIPRASVNLVATLGHELRHATEIAGMPDIRDEASCAAAYRRIGVAKLRDGYFETDAAVETGRQVAREIAASEQMAKR